MISLATVVLGNLNRVTLRGDQLARLYPISLWRSASSKHIGRDKSERLTDYRGRYLVDLDFALSPLGKLLSSTNM